MSFTRRTFLAGATSGLSVLVLTSCTDEPTPTPTAKPTTKPSVVPSPSRIARSSWSKDQLARGSHSFVSVGSTPEQREALAKPIDDRIFFAGEATSLSAPATVRGAFESGERAAGEVRAVATSGDRVAVIGAGAAGAAAARSLADAGFDVVLVEARDRVGGRIHTIGSDNWAIPVELGAWLLREQSDLGVISRLSRSGIGATATIGPTRFSDGEPIESLEPSAPGLATVIAAIEWAATQAADSTIDAALTGSKQLEKAEGETVAGVTGSALVAEASDRLAAATGADLAELSSWFGLPPVEQLREGQLAVTGGFREVIRDELDGIEAFFATTVLGINHTDETVSLRLGTGESLTVDRVVVTVPLGVLKNNGIDFEPLLPFGHRAAIAELGFGTVDTVWLQFDEPFWDADAAAWSLVGTDELVTQWINLLPLVGEPILVGIVGGDAALSLAELSDADFERAVLASLEPFAATS